MRPQDLHQFDRNQRAAILRICTVNAVGASKIDIVVPGGAVVPNVSQLTSFTATVGARVAVLMDRDVALAIGLVK